MWFLCVWNYVNAQVHTILNAFASFFSPVSKLNVIQIIIIQPLMVMHMYEHKGLQIVEKWERLTTIMLNDYIIGESNGFYVWT